MGEVAYVAEIRIEPREGRVRAAYLPAEDQPVLYGVHGAVAAHYGVEPGTEPVHATTLDHVVGAAAG